MTKYVSKISRRDSLKWISTMGVTVLVGGIVVGCDALAQEAPQSSTVGHWPNLTPNPVSGPTYGTDPDMVNPSVPWSKTLTADQLNMVAHLSDIICPEDEGGPSATAVGVPDFIDEWVSAPYEPQQKDRVLILNGLQWLDDEAGNRFGKAFMASSGDEQIAIIDDIAYKAQAEKAEFEQAVMFFAKLRTLVLGAYFSSPEGIEDIGYMGNVPIIGDYPGPTEEAMAHLNQVIANLPD